MRVGDAMKTDVPFVFFDHDDVENDLSGLARRVKSSRVGAKRGAKSLRSRRHELRVQRVSRGSQPRFETANADVETIPFPDVNARESRKSATRAAGVERAARIRAKFALRELPNAAKTFRAIEPSRGGGAFARAHSSEGMSARTRENETKRRNIDRETLFDRLRRRGAERQKTGARIGETIIRTATRHLIFKRRFRPALTGQIQKLRGSRRRRNGRGGHEIVPYFGNENFARLFRRFFQGRYIVDAQKLI